MVGDGLNDSPSLAAASVSASPASAADISQTVADMVFQGSLLAPVAALIETARRARRVMRQNLALSIGYNVLMVPLAVAGFVTPWLAAAAMSSSSLLVHGEQLSPAGPDRHERHPLPARCEPDPRRRRPRGIPVVAPLRPVPRIWKAPPTASCSTMNRPTRTAVRPDDGNAAAFTACRLMTRTRTPAGARPTTHRAQPSRRR